MSYSGKLLNLRKVLWEPSLIAGCSEVQVTTWNLQLVSEVGMGGQSCGPEPLICRVYTTSRKLVPELSEIVGHPVGVL